MSETFLVTGALGCLGAWVCRRLVDEGTTVVAYDLGSDRRRLELIMAAAQLERMRFVHGDITDLGALERALDEHGVTNVVHLAALQVPFCRDDPALGARVNVVGTVNVLEAVRRRSDRIGTVAYASSAAVYAPHGERRPATHYGVYKLANEGNARIYWQDSRVASIGLRPFTVYGPGRDQGMTAAPTHAMLAASRGEPYRIPFGGRMQFHYAPDVALAFVEASRMPAEGAFSHDLGGPAAHVAELVEAIRTVVPDARVEFDEQPLPFPEEPGDTSFPFVQTPLLDGVRQTIEHFRTRDLG